MKPITMRSAAAAIALLAAGPVLAQDAEIDPATLTCAEFVQLDPDGQAAAVAKLHDTAKSAENDGSVEGTSAAPPVEGTTDAGAPTESAADMEKVDGVMVACEGNDDMLVADVIAAKE